MRNLTVAVVIMIASAAIAQAPFAALTVTPRGAQQYDITTGVTTLPDGGKIVDQDTGVTLDAATIHYLAGSTIDATKAVVEGSFGTLTAPVLHIDIPSGTLTASGTVQLNRDGLSLTAKAVTFDAEREVVDFAGPVTATAPDLQADRVLLDTRSGDVLLLGHYRYSDGLLTLTAPKAGGKLELDFHLVDGNPTYDASTEVSSALLARFASELP